jgi:tRNA A-37 threonylcarbamoyl transferase component Bud32
VLAEGGMSRIYLGHPLQGAGLVAIKQRVASSHEDDEEDLRQFRKEFEILGALAHPSLPRVLEFFEESGSHYLVEEFVPGESLENYLAHEGSLDWQEAVDLAVRLLQVLEHLHRHGVVYRDLKPANILLTREGVPRLIDFGAARRYRPGAAHDTVPLGTPGFAAPEQYGRAQSDARSDVYSTGALLHLMLTGLDPTRRQGWSFHPPHELRPKVPEFLGRVVMKALEFRPDRRFQTSAHMIAALKAVSLAPGQKGGPRSSLLWTLERRICHADVMDYYLGPTRSVVASLGLALLGGTVPLWLYSPVVACEALGLGLFVSSWGYLEAYLVWRHFRRVVVEVFEEGVRFQRGVADLEAEWGEIRGVRVYRAGEASGPETADISWDAHEFRLESAWPGYEAALEAVLRWSGLVPQDADEAVAQGRL